MLLYYLDTDLELVKNTEIWLWITCLLKIFSKLYIGIDRQH